MHHRPAALPGRKKNLPARQRRRPAPLSGLAHRNSIFPRDDAPSRPTWRLNFWSRGLCFHQTSPCFFLIEDGLSELLHDADVSISQEVWGEFGFPAFSLSSLCVPKMPPFSLRSRAEMDKTANRVTRLKRALSILL